MRVMGWVGGDHKGSVTKGMYRRKTVRANGGARAPGTEPVTEPGGGGRGL